MPLPETFRALADPTRRRILDLLKKRSMAAGEIAEQFDMTGATISHHLSVLKNAGLVSDRHEGRYIYYDLNLSVLEELIDWFGRLVEGGNSRNEK